MYPLTLDAPSCTTPAASALAPALSDEICRGELAACVEDFNAEICPASRVRLLHRIRTLRRELGSLPKLPAASASRNGR